MKWNSLQRMAEQITLQMLCHIKVEYTDYTSMQIYLVKGFGVYNTWFNEKKLSILQTKHYNNSPILLHIPLVKNN